MESKDPYCAGRIRVYGGILQVGSERSGIRIRICLQAYRQHPRFEKARLQPRHHAHKPITACHSDRSRTLPRREEPAVLVGTIVEEKRFSAALAHLYFAALLFLPRLLLESLPFAAVRCGFLA